MRVVILFEATSDFVSKNTTGTDTYSKLFVYVPKIRALLNLYPDAPVNLSTDKTIWPFTKT